ncbi:MAG: DEAD/DEAH box helicase [Patescibacteria group bacterium]|jgi:ATP-dependent RNA helicase RhlE
MTKEPQNITTDFSGLGIAPSILEMLVKLKILTPTPIQKQAIPIAIQGKDVMGVAQTGTGKTFAFGIPMIQRLHQINGRGLVILPTRELALQVDEALRKIGRSVNLKTTVLIGGMPMHPQLRALASDPHIVIGTPGRINDHLVQKSLRLENTKIVVLDEADRMLDMGFAPQIKEIFKNLPADRQTMLFSATMPPVIIRMATALMKLPIRIEVAPTGTTADNVTQEIFILPKDAKVRMVEKLLAQYLGPVLIFSRTKHGAKRLSQMIHDFGHTAAELHSNRSLGQRREALDGFKSGRFRVLIATDIASRGIDVIGIELVLNFDLPANAEDYVHRIGRTARAGSGGHAISLVTPDQRGELRDIERLVKKNLPISKVPDLPPARNHTFTNSTGSSSARSSRPPRSSSSARFSRTISSGKLSSHRPFSSSRPSFMPRPYKGPGTFRRRRP